MVDFYSVDNNKGAYIEDGRVTVDSIKTIFKH